jgi:monoamine oxidase
MKRLTRRTFLAASAASATGLGAGPAFDAPRPPPQPPGPPEAPRSGQVEVVVVGAGAAGIAAARRLAASKVRVVLVEAANVAGGRCITDTTTFGVPYDRGAHWIYASDINPVAKLAAQVGVDIYPAPPGQRLRIGRRFAREGEIEDFLSNIVRANSAIADVSSRARADVSADKALPKDISDWRATVEFVLGPYGCSRDLAEVSTYDLARMVAHDNNAFARQGLGALLQKLIPPATLITGAPVSRIGWWGRGWIEVETSRGTYQTRAVVVTASTNVLLANKIRFQPEIPKRQLDALGRLKLGSFDQIALELPGNPLGLRSDELMFEKAENRRTGVIFGNIAGSTICTVGVGGNFGRDLSAKGEKDMIDFALTWLEGLYGTDFRAQVKRSHATRWNHEPWVLGATSTATPGAQPMRKVLMEPLNNRVFFAGEAAHETLWGTVGGAWESGERAAEAVLKTFGRR